MGCFPAGWKQEATLKVDVSISRCLQLIRVGYADFHGLRCLTKLSLASDVQCLPISMMSMLFFQHELLFMLKGA